MKNKLLILLITFFALFQNASAQAPENVNYQAIARDTSGNPLANQALTVRLSVVKGTITGPIQWQETHATTTNSFGQYRIQLGTGTSTGLGISASFSSINWGNNNYFLRTEINPGTGFVNMGTDPLSSVPYALFAKNTAALPNGTSNGQVLSWNGTSWVPASVCSLLTQYYRDADGDGYGNAAVSAGSCFQPAGYVLNSADCNDNLPSISPVGIEICNTIDDNCDGLIDNGAPTLTDVNNCGTCGNVCPTRPNSNVVCTSGLCGFVCISGFANCNNIATDGCEISLLSDVNNCGICGNVCPNPPNASSVCVAGTCSIICNSGFANCNGNNADGCEVNLNISLANCGSCGNACALPNANSACVAGACSIVSCITGFKNCDGITANGCETNINFTVNNCGNCGVVCTAPNATMQCSNGICFIATCNTGFANCNGVTSDGCEVNILSNVNNCSSCGLVCPTRPNSTSNCVSGTCSITCNTGFANCDGNITNGCEINILTNKNNCGACGVVCPGAQICTGGVCN